MYYYEPMFDCKLICTDIDGTLLDPEHNITDRTREAIRKARKRGIIVALVSGRISSSLKRIQEQLGITGPLGCFNGSLVLDEAGSTLEAHPITLSACRQVLSFLEGSKLETFVFTNETWYMNQHNAWYDTERKASKTDGKVLDLNLLEQNLAENERPFKLLSMSNDPDYVKRMKARLEQAFSASLNIVSSSPRYIEISARGVDKGHAVRSLCNAYAIAAGSVLAVGDYYNDIGMFRAAGYPVAMGNAPEEVKAHAAFVTASNKEDGLAQIIEAVL